MSGAWAVCLARDDAAAIGRLRRRPGIEVCEAEAGVWLRGSRLDDDLDRALRGLPGGRRFRVLPDRQLVPADARVPEGHLPEASWTPIAEWVSPRSQPAALPGELPCKATLRVVRCDLPREANVLLTTLPAWREYAAEAPQIRLDRWAFAVGDRSRVVIFGSPPPPIPGTRYVAEQGVAVPCGWAWSPPVEAPVVQQALGIGRGDLALLHADGTWDHIRAGDLVRATRSAVRLSAGADTESAEGEETNDL